MEEVYFWNKNKTKLKIEKADKLLKRLEELQARLITERKEEENKKESESKNE